MDNFGGDANLLFSKVVDGEPAVGYPSTSGFTVLKGSKVSGHIAPSFSGTYYDLRRRLEENGVIADGVFQVDYEFSSPSAAAAVVSGCNANGNTAWKTAEGVKLGEMEAES